MFISPDLSTRSVGKNHRHFESLDSTNDYLKRLKDKGKVAEGFTVTTDYQTSGRGQIGNAWQAESGANILTSIFLRPTSLVASEFFHLNMSVCLAIVESLNFFHRGFQVKWPNDILFDKKKVAGVLIENGISENKLAYSIIGVGINVNQQNFSAEAVPHATSLSKIMDGQIHREFLLETFLESLDLRYRQLLRGTARLKEEYLGALYGYGKAVDVLVDGKQMRATITDVLPDGVLATSIEGERRRFRFREIRFLL